MSVGNTRLKQFPWCESRPDGRRAIRNHQEAHARGVRNARKVVDTSAPKFFKARAPKGSLDAAAASLASAEAIESNARAAASLLSRGWGGSAEPTEAHGESCMSQQFSQQAESPARSVKLKRPFSAPLQGQPRVRADKGAPLPQPGSPARSVVLSASFSAAAADRHVAADHQGVDEASAYTASPLAAAGAAGSAFSRGRVQQQQHQQHQHRRRSDGGGCVGALPEEHQSAYRAFVALLAACPAEGAASLLQEAFRESAELRMLSDFG